MTTIVVRGPHGQVIGTVESVPGSAWTARTVDGIGVVLTQGGREVRSWPTSGAASGALRSYVLGSAPAAPPPPFTPPPPPIAPPPQWPTSGALSSSAGAVLRTATTRRKCGGCGRWS